MTLNEYQEAAKRTIDDAAMPGESISHALHGIVAETGEIHALYQKTHQGHHFTEENLKEEIGDLMWFIAELCTAYRFNLDEVCQANIDKLLKRYPNGFESSRSIYRESEVKA